jgi:hypothetical protein
MLKSRTSPKKARPNADLPLHLQELARDALQAIQELIEAEASYAWRLARLARAAHDHPRGRGSWLDACASVLGMTRQSLHPYVLLGSRWDLHDLQVLLRHREQGRRISLAQLFLIARRPRPEREEWIARIRRDDITVRGLRQALRTNVSNRSTVGSSPNGAA